MRLFGISSVIGGLSLMMVAGSAQALPAAKAPDTSAERSNLEQVHWRRYRHCHWRYGYRRCHGGYAYRPYGYSYGYGYPYYRRPYYSYGYSPGFSLYIGPRYRGYRRSWW